MATEAERIVARGVEVVVAGESLQIVFDFDALEQVEEEFGGLYDFTQALNGGWRSRRLKALRVSLVAGQSWREHAGERIRPSRAIRTGEVTALLDRLLGAPDFFEQVEEALKRLGEAFDQAVPPPPSARDLSRSKGSARVRRSPGPTSTEGPSSSSDSPQESSVG